MLKIEFFCRTTYLFVHFAQGNPNMVMALAGNKSDMLDARKVAPEASICPLPFSLLYVSLIYKLSNSTACNSALLVLSPCE